MNENAIPLTENMYVKELLAILQENNKDTSGLAALFGHVKSMEDFVRQAENQIADMKSQLDTMREMQNHPVKSKLQNAIKALETKVAQVKTQIIELKTAILSGCKDAVTAFKQHGISALDKLAMFFHIKSGLRMMNNNLVQSVNRCDMAVSDIHTFANEYHRVELGLKNMARMAVGRKPIDGQKEAGKLARTISALYKAEKTCLLGIKKAATAAIGKLEQLEQKAEQGHSAHTAAKKPTLTERINSHKERIKAQERERPVPERPPKAKEAEL